MERVRVRDARRGQIDGEIEDTQATSTRLARTVASYAEAFPDADPLALAAHLELVVTGNTVSDLLVRHLAESGFEIRRPRFTLLRLLYLSPERRLLQNEIAREMGVTPANVTQIIDTLETDGWVERIVSPTDRRFTYAQLTPAGQEACAKLVPAIVEFMASTCAALAPEEVPLLLDMLTRLRRDLQSRYSGNTLTQGQRPDRADSLVPRG
jgi:DNA-binding MarR family transcriptional regulator